MIKNVSATVCDIIMGLYIDITKENVLKQNKIKMFVHACSYASVHIPVCLRVCVCMCVCMCVCVCMSLFVHMYTYVYVA